MPKDLRSDLHHLAFVEIPKISTTPSGTAVRVLLGDLREVFLRRYLAPQSRQDVDGFGLGLGVVSMCVRGGQMNHFPLFSNKQNVLSADWIDSRNPQHILVTLGTSWSTFSGECFND